MEKRLRVALLAPVVLDDVVARVELDAGAGSVEVVLRGGRFDGAVPGTPTRLHLTLGPLPDAAGDAGGGSAAAPTEPAITAPPLVAEVATLFDAGVAIPADGELVCAVTWGTACDESRTGAPGPGHTPAEGTRFGSFEHMLCAETIGLDAAGAPLCIEGTTTTFDRDTPFEAGGKELRFGEIIALSGDYYAHLDDQAADALADAWPARSGFIGLLTGDYRATTLRGDDARGPRAILDVVMRDRDKPGGLMAEALQIAHDLPGAYPARRYLALACSNYCHFASQPDSGLYVDGARNEALRLYRAYHGRALAEAAAGAQAVNRDRALHASLVTDAFGCHFLTDLFASGHIRVPRRALGERFGVLKGSLRMSAQMHEEDNREGLWCTPLVAQPGQPRLVWRAFGDGALRKDEARPHLDLVREAVRRSVAEVFAAWCAGSVPAIAPADRAEALIPAPLAAGEAPRGSDRLPGGMPLPAGAPPNHFPLFRLLDDGSIARRDGAPSESRYQQIAGPLTPATH